MSNSSSTDLVVVTREDDIVTLTFQDPDRLNAMTRAMGEAFSKTVAEVSGDASVRAVILTGSGRAFSAGGDLGMIQGLADAARDQPRTGRRETREFMRSFYKLFLCLRDFECPTLAAINGHAIGAGLCVALACDIRVVAEEARLGLNFTKLGLHPGMAATWTLPRLVGPALAAELLYTSRQLSGTEAASIGLANRALPRDEVLATTREMATQIAGCAPFAVRGTKRALARTFEASLEDQLSFEAHEQSICFEGHDVQEGVSAARDKREPGFKGH